MKRLVFAFALTAVILGFGPEAKSQEVSVDFFYNNLNGGSWIEVGNYGYCWQPDVVRDSSWRPYADGYWAYTDLGWTWVSYEDFGWATYHYGRWVRLTDYGWVWVPGYRWGPAWVSWRFGSSYVGWAPLPPETEVIYESRPLSGHLDVEFDIGPASYNFVDVRYLGEPVLRSRIVPYEQNLTYVTQTVNVTNITYKNKTVYNYGPDLTTVNQYSTRPIQKLKLERQANADVATAAKSGSLTKVQGNSLIVAAPTEIKKAPREVAPPNVKPKVSQPKIEKGWSIVGDENARNQFKEKLKAEDLNKVPPPAPIGKPAAARGGSASVAPGVSASPAVAASPFEKGQGKGKGKRAAQFQAGAGASPSAGGAITSPAASPEFGKKGKGKNKNRGTEQFQSGAAVSPIASPGEAASATGTPVFGKHGKRKEREQFGGTGPTAAPTSNVEEAGKPPTQRKGFERQTGQTPPSGPTSSPEGGNQPRGGGKHKQFEQPATSPTSQENAGSQGGPSGEGRGKHKAEGVNAPPSAGGQPAGGAEQGQGKHEGKGKGKSQGESPTPGPQ